MTSIFEPRSLQVATKTVFYADGDSLLLVFLLYAIMNLSGQE